MSYVSIYTRATADESADMLAMYARRLSAAKQVLALAIEHQKPTSHARANVGHAQTRYDYWFRRYTNPFGVNKYAGSAL